MQILIAIAIVLLIYIYISRKKSKNIKKLTLEQLVRETFSKYRIIEKFGTVMICEINHRNELDEIVFIRINENGKKSIKQSGKRLVAEYPRIPTKNEMKKDFRTHLK